MRLQHTATPAAVVGWQFVAVLISGLGLAWLIGHAPPILALGAVFALILGIVFIERPDVGLMLLLVARASTDASLVSFGNAVGSQQRLVSVLLSPNSALILILVVGGGLFLIRRGLRIIHLPVVRIYGLLLLIGLIGIVRSNSLFSVNEWLRVASPLIVYSLVVHLFQDTARTQKIIDILAVSFILPAIFGFYQLVTGVGRELTIGVTRIHSTFTHPNPFAVYLVVILSVFLCQSLDQSKMRKWLSSCIAIASSILLLGTFSRFAWVGATVAVLTIGLLRSRVLLVILPLIAAIAIGMIPGVSARIEDPLQDSSFRGRLELWEKTFGGWTYETSLSGAPFVTALDRITGFGPGAYAHFSSTYVGRVIAPHSDYVRLLLEYGLFGLALYVALYFMLIRFAYYAWKQSHGPRKTVALSLVALAFAYPIMGTTANLFGQTVSQFYFWALAGLVATGGLSARAHALTQTREALRPDESNSGKASKSVGPQGQP